MPWTYASLFVLATLLGGSGTTYEAAHPAVYAGTYAVRLCHGSCAASAYFTGTLVLFGQPLRNARGRVFRAWLDRYPVNGCFVRAKASAEGLDGIGAQGFFSWALRDGAVHLDLARSADGGYGVSLTLAPKGLRGTGTWWGGAMGAVASGSPPATPDAAIADRLGVPDITRCPPIPKPVRPVGMIGR